MKLLSSTEILTYCVEFSHGRTGRKKLGGRKEICPTFSDCARVVKKKFPQKLSKIVVDGGGRSDYEKLKSIADLHWFIL
jgi:hypothetical protein